MAEPYLRLVVTHAPLKGERTEQAVYHVTDISLNEPFVVYSDTGGVVRIKPAPKEG